MSQEIFAELKQILQPYASAMIQTTDAPGNYSLDCPKEHKPGMRMFFGGSRLAKNYVSFYLMPVYVHPELLDGISPELRKRMQGKSCFNFKKQEPALFEELRALTAAAHERFRQEGWLG
jgi:hypothetical protein